MEFLIDEHTGGSLPLRIKLVQHKNLGTYSVSMTGMPVNILTGYAANDGDSDVEFVMPNEQNMRYDFKSFRAAQRAFESLRLRYL